MKKASAAEVLPAIGAPFEGGRFAGRFFIDAKPYGLVLAPKLSEIEEIAWNDTPKRVTGALSVCDGLANTKAMAKAGSALAEKLLKLEIGGHADWYLGSRLEGLVLFGNDATGKAFVPDAIARLAYWTSSQYAGLESYAWFQYFGDGSQNGNRKDGKLRARAVRRFAL